MKFPIVSSNTLFHFTNKPEHLINILDNDFRPRLRKEEFGCLTPELPNPELYSYAFPMTCFCDLPLSNIRKHLKQYGKYGIGLTKKRGMSNGLNPVLYLQKDAQLWKNIYHSNMVIQIEASQGSKFNDEIIRGFTALQFFIKPYEGDFCHRGKTESDVRFYDEREWRFVPLLPNEEYYMSGAKYNLKSEAGI